MPVGTTLYNMFKGKIIQVQNNHAELGKWIIVESTVGGIKIQMWYAHMSDIDVVEDQEIDKNFILGESGESGNANNPGSAGPHLHLAARKKINGKWKKIYPINFKLVFLFVSHLFFNSNGIYAQSVDEDTDDGYDWSWVSDFDEDNLLDEVIITGSNNDGNEDPCPSDDYCECYDIGCPDENEDCEDDCECYGIDCGDEDEEDEEDEDDDNVREDEKEEDCAKLEAANEVYDDNQPTFDGQFSDQSHLQTNVGGDWNLADVSGIAGLRLTNTDNGFSSRLYSREVNGQIQFMYVTEGTDLGISDGADIKETIDDLRADVEQIFGHSEQYDLSLQNATILDQYVSGISGASLVFVGHSLGGGQASYNSLGTGWDAYTYNPAGLSSETLGNLSNPFASNIEATVVNDEIVSHLQDYFSGIKSLEIQGNITNLDNPSSDWINALDKLSKISNTAQVAELYLRIKSHLIDAIKEAMGCP